MKLDKALEFAVILAWEDLKKSAAPRSVRVEYQCEPGSSLDSVNVWLVSHGGRQDLVCDYWTWTSPTHPSGIRFRNGLHSDQLTQTLDCIMHNQDQFTRPADACRDGLVLIYPPTEDEREEAACWMKWAHATATNFGGRVDERLPRPWIPLTGKRVTVSRWTS